MEESITREHLLEEMKEMRRRLELLDSCRLEMQLAQTKYRVLLESAPDAMLFIGRDGRIVLVNAQLERAFGYTEQELLGKDLLVLIPERYHQSHKRKVDEYFSRPRPRPMGSGLEIYALRKDGTEFPADISLSPLETDGQMLAIASVRDITERKRAELQIERNYQIQRTIASVLKISLEPVTLDSQLQRVLDLILAVPRLAPRAAGALYLVEDEPEVLVLKAQRTAPGSPTPCERVSFGTCICGKAAADCTVAFTSCVDERHEIRRSVEFAHGHYCVPIASAGRTWGLINIFLDEGHERSDEEEMFLVAAAHTLAAVIMRRQAEAETNRFREQLAETEKIAALGRITANVAHEIRNPLTAIGGFARRLDKKLPEASKEKEYVEFIVGEVARLERILRNVLSLSRGAAPRLEECHMREIVEEALGVFEEACAERSITIERALEETPPVRGERESILEAIENLVSNAIDAMAGGGVLSVATGEETIKGVAYVTVRVADTGEGIGEEEMGRIFEPFFTTRVSSKRIGLGLSIAKRFVEDHGGIIRAESTKGAGSSFMISFPLEPGDPPERG
jgi:PAS domain S-box-containing protein